MVLFICAGMIVVVASVAIIVSVIRVFFFVQGARFMPSCLRFSLGWFCDMSCVLFSGARAPFPGAFGQDKEARFKRERTVDTKGQVGWTKI